MRSPVTGFSIVSPARIMALLLSMRRRCGGVGEHDRRCRLRSGWRSINDRRKGPGAMELRILGPIEAADGGLPLALGAPKQRAVLAALALRRNRVVTREQLVDAVWGEHPPEAATRSLQVYV